MRLACFLTAAALPVLAEPVRVDPPAGQGSGMPFLTTSPGGSAYLTWTDTISAREHALRFSRWTGGGWTPPETIARGENWFVNWADFGSLSVLADGSMLAHWLTRSGGGAYGYGIRVARREPDRPVWREVHGMSLDEKTDYAGFLTFVPGAPEAVYLSPPGASGGVSHGAGHDHRKTVRVVSFSATGAPAAEREIDASACSCCQTAIAKTENGLVVAYRDRLPGEIRDISVARFQNGVWSQPETVHRDGWRINACPTDGPAMASRGRRVAVAWLTRAQDQPRILMAFSADEARSFTAPVRVDSGNPLGRPALVELDRESYAVAWLEKTAGEDVEVRLRRVSFRGERDPPRTVAAAPAGRAAGFPKVAVSGGRVLVAWRDGRVRAAWLDARDLDPGR